MEGRGMAGLGQPMEYAKAELHMQKQFILGLRRGPFYLDTPPDHVPPRLLVISKMPFKFSSKITFKPCYIFNKIRNILSSVWAD
jgi:hypothetical protein